MPYRGTGELLDLLARGEGSLAGSVVSADMAFVRDVVLGAAPWHGRILVLDRDCAAVQGTPAVLGQLFDNPGQQEKQP